MTGAAGARILEIEQTLGDPWDAANTCSLVSLAADFTADSDPVHDHSHHRRAVLDRLGPDGLGLDADCTAVSADGGSRRLDRLGRISRHVLGRDADLALAAGLGSLPASPLSSSVCASALVGLGDTALRLGVRATDCRDGEAPGWLADSFADLLIADAVATVACRSVHLPPGHRDVLAAAARWQTAQLIGEIVYAVALRAPVTPSATAGPLAKLVHDFTTMTRRLQQVEPAHLVLGRRLPAPGTDGGPPPCSQLYDVAADVPDLTSAGSTRIDGDWLYPVEDDDLALLAGCRHRSVLNEQYRQLAAEARLPRDRVVPADGDRLVDPARRRALLLAATASVRVWAAARDGTGPDAARPADETWLLVALDRLLFRLGLSRPHLPTDVRGRLTDVALQRIRESRSLDLYADRTHG